MTKDTKKNEKEKLKKEEKKLEKQVEEKNQKEKTEKKCNCEELKLKVIELEDKLLRNQAELINFKKRTKEETETIIKFANQQFIMSFLPLLDSFETAFKVENSTPEMEKFLEGFKMIYSEVLNFLKKEGLEEIETKDQMFDPNFHQAVCVDYDESKPEDMILEELQKGYKLHGRILRPSMVKVNKKE